MNGKLQEIKEEYIVIFIYFILLFTYLYANKVEVEYLRTGNNNDREMYRILLYIVFGVSFLITLYYTIESFNSLKEYDGVEIHKLKELSAFANFMILIATGIYLYIIYKDKNIDLEVSP